MKKRTAILISLILALTFLTGCVLPFAPEENLGPERQLVSFDEMEYVFPDMEYMQSVADKLQLDLKNPFSIGKVNRLLDEFYALCEDFDTMYALAYIRSSQDLRDEHYAGEYERILIAEAGLPMLIDSVYYACADSVHSWWLERFKFWEGFADEYSSDTRVSDEAGRAYTALKAEEAALLGEYRSILSDLTVEIDGQERDFDEYMAHVSDREYAAAYEAYYEKYNPILGEIYIELLSLRRKQAELLGYDSYAEMAYLGYERDYSPEEAEEYMACVRRYIVPLACELRDSGAFYDIEYRPLEERGLTILMDTAAAGLGGSIEEAYDFMREYELYDLAFSPYKSAQSFTSYLPAYAAPFMFVSPCGDSADTLTAFHEFGHYADCFIRHNAYESLDLSETFSQAMQLLCMEEIKYVMDEADFEALYRMNLMDMVDSFVQQTALAEFELRALEMESPSVEKLNALCLELSKVYGFYDEDSVNIYPYFWSDTPHLFEYPMYVISYPVSAAAALELYLQELEAEGSGAESFQRMSESCLPGLRETLEYAGLANPMSEQSIKNTADFLCRSLIA